MKRISPRKEPTQARSIALRESIIEAAACILKREGADAFSTNRVAQRAGVNIASLYQYYPNKESLLFHLIEIQWKSVFETVYPILADIRFSHKKRMHLFVQNFFAAEMEDRQLKDVLSNAGQLIEETREYEDLLNKGLKVLIDFLSSRGKKNSTEMLRSEADFIQHIITSFSECKKATQWKSSLSDARRIADMICYSFGLGD